MSNIFKQPFTVTMLHSRLVTMRWRLAYTPIYALLSEHGGHSIEITQLPSSEESTPSSLDPMDVSPSQSSILSTQIPSSRSSAVADTRVLLAVSIENDAVHDISQWKTWLTSQTPWDVTKVKVKVEAVFESHSTMLLASIPIFAWDILPNKPSYVCFRRLLCSHPFIENTHTSNLLTSANADCDIIQSNLSASLNRRTYYNHVQAQGLLQRTSKLKKPLHRALRRPPSPTVT